MPSLGPMELIIILVIVMLIFGVGKLSDIGGALGKSVREFRKSTIEDDTQEKASTSKDNKERETTT
ncbi:MAG: twin-arginine translocase TatA/TatE family subunit [Dehalococcoidia bacterium]|nr:twin-arginine translocase TatA/TatE family subunit [Dehalococcoidia bacterium]